VGWAEDHCTARSCCRPVRLAVAHAACELPTVGQVRRARGQSQRSAGVQREREREPAFRSRVLRTDRDADVRGTARDGAPEMALHRAPRNADHMCTIFMQGP
jgi:hypothetical protein